MTRNSISLGTSRSLRLVVTVAMILVFAFASGATRSYANLSGSTFEGGDGNLIVDTPGNTDWANVAGRVGGIDQPSGTSDNSFGQGTKEDNAAVSVVTGSIPPNKSDLTRFYQASEVINGQTYLYLAWERTNVLGSANMDFEINQHTTPGFTGTFTGPITINRTPGDLLVTYDFTNGGSTPTLGLLTWLTSGHGSASQCYSSSTLPCWGNHISLTSANSEGAINTTTVTDPIAPNAPRSLPALTFGEAAINLTGVGVVPSGACATFGSTFLKSRSSASFTAEVKDFVAPVPFSGPSCTTSISTALSPASPVSVGTAVHDSATLMGQTGSAGGTVTYTVYTDSACTLGAQDAGTKTVTNGIVPDSNPITFNGIGTFYWQAVYSGDTSNLGSTSPCTSEQLLVNDTTSITSAQNWLPNDSATVTSAGGTPLNGTLSFTLYDGSDCGLTGTGVLRAAQSFTLTNAASPVTMNTTNTTTLVSATENVSWKVVFTSSDSHVSGFTKCESSSLAVNN